MNLFYGVSIILCTQFIFMSSIIVYGNDVKKITKDTPILLLDEATSALDVTTERRVLRNIVNRRPNKTCIVTSHRPSVLNLCQRVYRVVDTKVTELDSAEAEKAAMDF